MGIRLEIMDLERSYRRHNQLSHLFIILIEKLGLPFWNDIQNNKEKSLSYSIYTRWWFPLGSDGYLN